MRRILITGAGGFLARPLIARLQGRGRLVRIALSSSPGTAAFDLSDPERARAAARFARADEVYHLAGSAHSGDWNKLWRVHVSATVHLLEALTALGRPVRVVVAGSSAEYGAAGGARRVNEESPLEPVTAYGACKLSQSLAALSFARGPVEVVVARIFNALGPGVPANLAPGAFARQVARISAGLQPPEVAVGDLAPRRDFIDARDAAAGLEVLMRRGRSGECYNLGSGRSVPISAILHGLAAAGGVRVRARIDRANFRRGEVRDLVADCRKLRALGWAPRYPLASSLADTLEWWSRR